MATTPLNSGYEFSATFFNATTGASRADLTVNAQLYDEAGEAVGSPAAVTPYTDDRYVYDPGTSVLDALGKWMVEFVPTVTTNVAPVVRRVEVEVVAASAGGTVDANIVSWKGDVPADLTGDKVNSTLGTELDAKIAAIGTSAAYAVSPTIAANTVRIVRGDDYSATDARAIDLVYSGQPDFTSATNVTMKIVSSSKAVSTTLATWTGSVVNGTTLRFTPTDTETALLPAINSATQITYPFEVSLTLASGSVITPTSLHAGKLIVDSQAT